MRQILIQFLKFALAAGIIAYFVRSGKIDLESLGLVARSPWVIASLLGLQFFNVGVNNFRWQLLLEGQGIRRGFLQTLPLTLIGLFFNLAIPGSVGGDVIKAIYIAREHSSEGRAKAIMSVGMDRIVGLFSFVLLALVAGLANLGKMMEVPQLRSLFIVVALLFAAFIGFFTFSFSSYVREHRLVGYLLSRMPGGRIIEKLYDAVHAYRRSRKQFALGILLSVLAQSVFVLGCSIIARQIGQPQGWATLFFVVPLGLIVTAIPVSPAGIGVGQVAFHQLFIWYLGQDSTVGATLITVMQAIAVLVGLLGAVVYFTRKGERPV